MLTFWFFFLKASLIPYTILALMTNTLKCLYKFLHSHNKIVHSACLQFNYFFLKLVTWAVLDSPASEYLRNNTWSFEPGTELNWCALLDPLTCFAWSYLSFKDSLCSFSSSVLTRMGCMFSNVSWTNSKSWSTFLIAWPRRAAWSASVLTLPPTPSGGPRLFVLSLTKCCKQCL